MGDVLITRRSRVVLPSRVRMMVVQSRLRKIVLRSRVRKKEARKEQWRRLHLRSPWIERPKKKGKYQARNRTERRRRAKLDLCAEIPALLLMF
jgi:hypothetical protein